MRSGHTTAPETSELLPMCFFFNRHNFNVNPQKPLDSSQSHGESESVPGRLCTKLECSLYRELIHILPWFLEVKIRSGLNPGHGVALITSVMPLRHYMAQSTWSPDHHTHMGFLHQTFASQLYRMSLYVVDYSKNLKPVST